MKKILALLSPHGTEGESCGAQQFSSPPSTTNAFSDAGSGSSGLVPGKSITIDNQRYTVDAVIAEGGFGIVYRVHSIPDGRQLALKRTLVNNSADLASMKREITIVSSLSHKNIISYVASKVVEREPEIFEVLLLTAFYPSSVSQILSERQHKGQRFQEVEVLRILADVCEAVSRLHHCETPIIHRDLKIENLLIDQRGNVVLCDFGSATSRILQPAKHGTLRCQGEIEKYTTLAYRAPEMVDLYSGVPLGPPVDIWALGCLLYGLCFFALPFGSGSSLAIQNGRYTVPANTYSPRLLKLIGYMLTISASERPDIFQVSALAFDLLGKPNPVLNVNSSSVPHWQNLDSPPTDSLNQSVPSRMSSLSVSNPNQGPSKSPDSRDCSRPRNVTVSPSIARRRPRASGAVSPSVNRSSNSNQVPPVLAKPPTPHRPSNPATNAFQNPDSALTSPQHQHYTKHHQQQYEAAPEASSNFLRPRRCGHRRGLSEASALLSNAENVRQTHSLGDLQPSNPIGDSDMQSKVCRLVIHDIDGDLFGAAFDAIRNQSKQNKTNGQENAGDFKQ